jgi:hypothetical protein
VRWPNAGLVACGSAEPFTALHLVLLPFNAWRLLRALRTAASSRPLAAATVKAGVVVAQRKAESTRWSAFDAMQTARLNPRAVR